VAATSKLARAEVANSTPYPRLDSSSGIGE
jgi:hypothetical protein